MDTSELEEQLAEAQAQIESLQSAVADAEARAATMSEKAASMESELEEARSQLRETLLRYREVRLAATPEVPADLVPEGTSLAEIDARFQAAQEMALRLREQIKSEHPPARVPTGSPARRAPDLSSLSPAEKIRLGLRERSER